MRIGIVSDTHGRIGIQSGALALLTGRGIDALAHCGDLGSTACLEQLAESGVPVWAVLGNTDQAESEFDAAARACGATLSRRSLVVPLGDGRTAAVTHGHDAGLLQELIGSGRHAYVLHGHTHRVRDERIGAVRVINPGSLHNSRLPGPGAPTTMIRAGAPGPTVALLDSAFDTVEFLLVPPTPCGR